MKRRAFISLLGGAAAWPLAANTQERGKQATVGFLGTGTADQSQWTAAFLQRMRELGWIEGRNLTIEYRWAEGHTERLPELANQLVGLNRSTLSSPTTLRDHLRRRRRHRGCSLPHMMKENRPRDHRAAATLPRLR